MVRVLRISGKARQVFKIIELLAWYNPNLTIGELSKQKGDRKWLEC